MVLEAPHPSYWLGLDRGSVKPRLQWWLPDLVRTFSVLQQQGPSWPWQKLQVLGSAAVVAVGHLYAPAGAAAVPGSAEAERCSREFSSEPGSAALGGVCEHMTPHFTSHFVQCFRMCSQLRRL